LAERSASRRPERVEQARGVLRDCHAGPRRVDRRGQRGARRDERREDVDRRRARDREEVLRGLERGFVGVDGTGAMGCTVDPVIARDARGFVEQARERVEGELRGTGERSV
jgi:hypothetical protein